MIPDPSDIALEVAAALVRLGVARDAAELRMVPLAGGVSSDIWRVDLPGRSVCVKRALPRLRVAALWEAPVERNAYEVEWMRVAAGIVPQAVPALLAHDASRGLFVMEYLDPARYPIGIADVVVNGRPVVLGGAETGERPGRLLRHA